MVIGKLITVLSIPVDLNLNLLRGASLLVTRVRAMGEHDLVLTGVL